MYRVLYNVTLCLTTLYSQWNCEVIVIARKWRILLEYGVVGLHNHGQGKCTEYGIPITFPGLFRPRILSESPESGVDGVLPLNLHCRANFRVGFKQTSETRKTL
jgi:hypothetical protein